MAMIIIIIIIRVIIISILIRVIIIVYFFQSFVLLPSFVLLSLVSLQMEEQRNSLQPSSPMIGTAYSNLLPSP